MLDAAQSWFNDPARAYALWFVLGALWAVLVCEYRAHRRRVKIVAHIRVLESELMAAEDHYLSERTQNDRIRAGLLGLLAAAQSSREHRPREVGDFASGRATNEHRPREVEDFASGRATNRDRQEAAE
jgi:hypothetical protein